MRTAHVAALAVGAPDQRLGVVIAIELGIGRLDTGQFAGGETVVPIGQPAISIDHDRSRVVGTHADACTALACFNEALPPFHYMVASFGGDDVRCAPYVTFGTRSWRGSRWRRRQAASHACAAAVVFISGLAGLAYRTWHPRNEEVAGETRDLINRLTGLVATLSALVLGLFIASASNFHNSQKAGLETVS